MTAEVDRERAVREALARWVDRCVPRVAGLRDAGAVRAVLRRELALALLEAGLDALDDGPEDRPAR